jgi:hypothetical protein
MYVFVSKTASLRRLNLLAKPILDIKIAGNSPKTGLSDNMYVIMEQ